MAQAKDISQSAAKWVRRAGSASQEYATGVANPRRSWSTAASGASKNYDTGVQAAVARGAYAKGVLKAGDEKWRKRSEELGSARFASGVQASQSAYETGFGPYLSTIQSVALPPRGSKGSPENLNRVAAIANALRAKKVGK